MKRRRPSSPRPSPRRGRCRPLDRCGGHIVPRRRRRHDRPWGSAGVDSLDRPGAADVGVRGCRLAAVHPASALRERGPWGRRPRAAGARVLRVPVPLSAPLRPRSLRLREPPHRRLSGLSRPGCSERGARVSRGAIVFARDCRGSAGRHSTASTSSARGNPSAAWAASRWRPSRSTSRAKRSRSRTTGERGARRVHLPRDDRAPGARAGRRRSRLLARERKLEAPVPSGTYLRGVSLDSGFAYWERQVFSTGYPPVDPFRQDIVRRPIDASAPEAQLERAGRLYVEPTGRTGSGATPSAATACTTPGPQCDGLRGVHSAGGGYPRVPLSRFYFPCKRGAAGRRAKVDLVPYAPALAERLRR